MGYTTANTQPRRPAAKLEETETSAATEAKSRFSRGCTHSSTPAGSICKCGSYQALPMSPTYCLLSTLSLSKLPYPAAAPSTSPWCQLRIPGIASQSIEDSRNTMQWQLLTPSLVLEVTKPQTQLFFKSARKTSSRRTDKD